LPDFTKNTALKKLFEELFRGITLDDIFDDVISTKTRNNVCGTKTADTLVGRTSLDCLDVPKIDCPEILIRFGKSVTRRIPPGHSSATQVFP
jgi:hypothetical protein